MKRNCWRKSVSYTHLDVYKRQALQSLLAMNGNMPLEFAETTYHAIQEINDYNVMRYEVMASDLDLQAAVATALSLIHI